MPKNYKILKKSRIRKKLTPRPKRNLKKKRSVKKMRGGEVLNSFEDELRKLLKDKAFLKEITKENVIEYKKTKKREEPTRSFFSSINLFGKKSGINLTDLFEFITYKIKERYYHGKDLRNLEYYHYLRPIFGHNWPCNSFSSSKLIESVEGVRVADNKNGLEINIKLEDGGEYKLVFKYLTNQLHGNYLEIKSNIKNDKEDCEFRGEVESRDIVKPG